MPADSRELTEYKSISRERVCSRWRVPVFPCYLLFLIAPYRCRERWKFSDRLRARITTYRTWNMNYRGQNVERTHWELKHKNLRNASTWIHPDPFLYTHKLYCKYLITYHWYPQTTEIRIKLFQDGHHFPHLENQLPLFKIILRINVPKKSHEHPPVLWPL